MASERIEERKAKDRQARRSQIIAAARKIADAEGWSGVTVRRLAEDICYSQPVLYSHFKSREAILVAVAVEGFQELGAKLESARKRSRAHGPLPSVAAAYLEFAASHPALYEVMFSLNIDLPFGESSTPSELVFAFT